MPMTIVALKALTRMRARDVRHLVDPLLDDDIKDVRRYAAKALEKLPE
jgi:uncharacterized protein (DUF2336 family)